MNTTHAKSPVRNGLRDIALEEFWKNPLLLVEVLQEKLQGLPIDPQKFPRMAAEVEVIKELLFAIATGRYRTISLLAFIDILHALDDFLVLNDQIPDSRTNGYKDDAEAVHRVFVKHETEIRAFKHWLASPK